MRLKYVGLTLCERPHGDRYAVGYRNDLRLSKCANTVLFLLSPVIFGCNRSLDLVSDVAVLKLGVCLLRGGESHNLELSSRILCGYIF